jgi:hypothetical protein
MKMRMQVTREVVALKAMTVAQLRRRYLEVFGEPTRSGNKDFLWKRIIWRMQALAEGDLSERARRRAEELANDADLRTRRPTGLPLSPDAHVVTASVDFKGGAGALMPGTILTRPYKGGEVQVVVRRDGYEYLGQVYKSLSAVAKAVTGAHWNGRRFFRLTQGGDE